MAPGRRAEVSGPPIRRDTLLTRERLVLLFGGAIILRLLLLQAYGGLLAFHNGGEASNVALAVASGRGFADAFFPGQGPTAHLLPASPLIAAGIFAALGKTAVVNVALCIWALAQSLVSYALLLLLFRRLGWPSSAALGAIAALCLLPVFPKEEVIFFRYWEGALAVCLAALSMLLIVRMDTTGSQNAALRWQGCALAALTFFISPPVGLGIYVAWTVALAFRASVRDAIRWCLTAACCVAVVLGPWVVRNHLALGRPILLRDNLGLELALGNNPLSAQARTAEEQAEAYDRALKSMHPYHRGMDPDAFAAAGGEVAYSASLGAAAMSWIAAHPVAFAQLCQRHLLQFFAPGPWQLDLYGSPGFARERSLLLSLTGLLGLLELARGLWLRRRGYAVLTAFVVTVSLPYALVQPIPRYTYLLYGILCFLAARLIHDLASAMLHAHRHGMGPPRLVSLVRSAKIVTTEGKTLPVHRASPRCRLANCALSDHRMGQPGDSPCAAA